jgi:hypothetical protein
MKKLKGQIEKRGFNAPGRQGGREKKRAGRGFGGLVNRRGKDEVAQNGQGKTLKAAGIPRAEKRKNAEDEVETACNPLAEVERILHHPWSGVLKRVCARAALNPGKR